MGTAAAVRTDACLLDVLTTCRQGFTCAQLHRGHKPQVPGPAELPFQELHRDLHPRNAVWGTVSPCLCRVPSALDVGSREGHRKTTAVPFDETTLCNPVAQQPDMLDMD